MKSKEVWVQLHAESTSPTADPYPCGKGLVEKRIQRDMSFHTRGLWLDIFKNNVAAISKNIWW